jgi:long-chain fatty acid transport protein
MKKRSSSALAAVGLALLLQLSSSSVKASGYPSISFGGELGLVVTTNPTAIYYNPGALGFSGTQLMVDAALALRSSSWTHHRGQGDAPEPPGFEGANYGTARSFLVAGGPQFAASLQLGKHLVLGAGVYVPFGGGTLQFDRNEKFANTMYPGAADGITRWHGYDVGMSFFYGTVGAAVRFGAVGIGATFNLIRASQQVKRAQNTLGTNDITREQRVSSEVSEIVASFGLGALWEVLSQQLWLGASYQAQPGLGELTMDGTYTLDATVDVMDQTRSQEVTSHQAMPDIFRAGLRFRPSSVFEIRLTGSFTRWSVNQTQCIGLRGQPCTVLVDGSAAPGSGAIKVLRRNWTDTVGAHIGLSYWLLPELEPFVGVSYETAAVPDATLDPLTADAENFTWALGGRVRLFDTWFIALSYNHKQFLPRDNTGRSDLANPRVRIVSRGVDGGGKYESWFATINLNLAKTF